MPRLRFVLLIPILAVRCDAADPAPPDAPGLPAAGPVTDTVASGDLDDDPARGEPEPPAPSDASCAGLPVVPCAFGFGMDTRAAYGGDAPPTIYRVTTLDDASPAPTGSLREAVEAPEPRVVVFEISGTIRLVKELEVRTPYLTLAGQTAPSPGILIRDYGFAIYSHDVLMQHVRIRPGWDPAVQNCNVGVYTYFTDDGALNAHDLVFDHLSVSWSAGKNAFFWNYYDDIDLTWWRGIMAEPLYQPYAEWNDAGQVDRCGSSAPGAGYGMGIGYATNISVLQSLFAQNQARNPGLGGTGTAAYFTNNLVFDWGENASYLGYGYGGPEEEGPLLVTLIGNHYRHSDPDPAWVSPLVTAYDLQPGYAELYIEDALKDLAHPAEIEDFVSVFRDPATGWWIPGGLDPRVPAPPVVVPGYVPVPSGDVFELVLRNAGARPLDRAEELVDQGVIEDVRNDVGRVVSAADDVRGIPADYPHGGYPALAVNARVLELPDDPHGDDDGDGYTNLEERLHEMARAVEAVP